jgi:ABC transporter with metal-binding/Fe-S-binding domain ATP-binding protein
MMIASLFSGGKDSVYAMYKLQKEQGHEITVLVTVISDNPESYMYHVPNIEHTELQAEALGIPIIIKHSKGEKEIELEDLKLGLQEAIDAYGIEGAVNGAIFSNYQRRRVDDICAELGIESFSPLWKQRPQDILTEMVNEGFKVIMSAVAAGGLGPEWLGVEITPKVIDQLSELHETCYVCTGGEGGEFETFVLDGPSFKRRLVIEEAERIWNRDSGIFKINRVRLKGKN